MKLLVDMNLSPDWLPFLSVAGWEVRHWTTIGPANAPDAELMRWAREHGHVVVTQDLDFSQLLFSTQASGPSVVLLRMENEFDDEARAHVRDAVTYAESALVSGALLTISGRSVRLRRLPVVPGSGGSSETD